MQGSGGYERGDELRYERTTEEAQAEERPGEYEAVSGVESRPDLHPGSERGTRSMADVRPWRIQYRGRGAAENGESGACPWRMQVPLEKR